MKKYNKKLKVAIVIILSICLLAFDSYAHSGKTDSSGGHKDKNNVSGLGYYHYHCGGHPAHLHPNGVCPYSSSNINSSTSKTTSSKSSTVSATSIQIDQELNSIEVGENKKLTATILPNNTTNKNITWKSSDESMATINSAGELTAKKTGVVHITASTTNGKSSTIKINIKEKVKPENNAITKDSIYKKSNTNVNNLNNNQGESNALGGIVALGVLGGGGYIGYKKYKKR